MSTLDQSVGRNLRALRASKRWTLEETVDLVGAQLDRVITISAYSRWETDRTRWSPSELLALCTVFEVPLARLMLPDIDQPWRDSTEVDVWNTLFAFTSHVRRWWPL